MTPLAKVSRHLYSVHGYDAEGCLFSVAAAYSAFKEALLFCNLFAILLRIVIHYFNLSRGFTLLVLHIHTYSTLLCPRYLHTIRPPLSLGCRANELRPSDICIIRTAGTIFSRAFWRICAPPVYFTSSSPSSDDDLIFQWRSRKLLWRSHLLALIMASSHGFNVMNLARS